MGADDPTRVEQTKAYLARINKALAGQLRCKYHEAARGYFTIEDYLCCRHWLDDPLSYFFLYNDKLYFRHPFPYRKGQTRLLSTQTIPSFFRFWLPGRDCRRSAERDAFFAALRRYLAFFPDKAPAVLPEEPQDFKGHYRIAPDKNLYVSTHCSPYFSYLPMLTPQDDPAHKNLHSSLKKHFTKVSRHPDPEKTILPLSPFQGSVLYHSSKSTFYRVSYCKGQDCFSSEEHQQLLVGTKFLKYYVNDAAPSERIISLFSGLTGESTALADQLFRLFARIMDPTPGATVIYTERNYATLIHLFKSMYQNQLCVPSFRVHPKSPSSLPSLNQLCSNSCLRQLYYQQGTGACLVLLRDLFPSDSKYALARALAYGKPISLTSPWLPKQTFRNTLHLVVLSTDKYAAAQLKRTLNATLINLADNESRCFDNPTLLPVDIAWINSKATLYGLMLEHGYAPPKRQAEPGLVEAFLTEHCFIHPGSFCDSFGLYETYKKHYQVLHDGVLPPISKGRFIKEVRQLLGQGALEHVQYKKCRVLTNEPPRWYFLGLDLPISEDPPPVPSRIEEYMMQIHNRIELPKISGDSIPEVRGFQV